MTQFPVDDYDSPWREVREHAFPELMAFYFPQAQALINWDQRPELKSTEFRQVVRDAELGKRFADTVFQVTPQDGQPRDDYHEPWKNAITRTWYFAKFMVFYFSQLPAETSQQRANIRQ